LVSYCCRLTFLSDSYF